MNILRFFIHFPVLLYFSFFLVASVNASELTDVLAINEESRLSEISQNKNKAIALRTAALIELGEYNGRNALIAIARATRDSEPAIREAAILAVEAWADTARWDMVSPLIEDKNYAVRQQATRVLLPLWSHLNQHQQAYMSGAIDEYIASLKRLPNTTETQLRLANAYLLTAQYSEAEFRYQTLIENASTNSRAYLELSELYRLQGDNPAAIALLSDAIEVLPANDRLRYSLALAYIRSGDDEAAIQHINIAINFVEDKSDYQFVLAMMLQEKDPKQAISLLETITTTQPSAQHQYALCNLYIDQQMRSDAKSCLNRLKNNIPESAFNRLNEKLTITQ